MTTRLTETALISAGFDQKKLISPVPIRTSNKIQHSPP